MERIAESPIKDHVKRHLKELGPYKDAILHSQVLTMTFIASARRSSGIIVPQTSRAEDRFQGKIGLVVAMGPGAFKDDVLAQFHGKKLNVGDWVLTRASDGWEIFYNGCTLRVFEDVNIKAIIADPTVYW